MLEWLGSLCCLGRPERDDENERQPLLAALATRRSFPPPTHILKRPEALSRGPTLAPHERLQGRQGAHGPDPAHPSPPKTATFAPTASSATSPAKSDSSTPKRTIRSAPSSPLVPTKQNHSMVGAVVAKGKGKSKADGWAGSPDKFSLGHDALRISPTSLARPAFKLPAVPEVSTVIRRRLHLDGPSTVPNSPSPGLTGPMFSRPGLNERATAPPTAQIQQSETVGPSHTSTRTDRPLKSIFPSFSDLRRKLASPPFDSQGGTTSGSSPIKPSTPVLHGPFGARILVPPLSPPLFGRSVSEPHQLHLHRRLSSGNVRQMVQSALQAHNTSNPASASASREDIRPHEIEGFAQHQLTLGRHTDPRTVMIASRGRPRASTAGGASTFWGGWLGPPVDIDKMAGPDIGEVRDRQRSESFSRSERRASSTRGGRGGRADGHSNASSRAGSRNASALLITMTRTISDEPDDRAISASRQATTRQRDGSVGRGYPGVAGQGRRGRSPGPSRLGSRNPSSESLWPFEGDQSRSHSQSRSGFNSRSGSHTQLYPYGGIFTGNDTGLGLHAGLPPVGGPLAHRTSLSAIAQSGLSHGTPDTAQIARHNMQQQQQQQRQRRQREQRRHNDGRDRHYYEDTPDEGMSEADEDDRLAPRHSVAGVGGAKDGGHHAGDGEDPESPGLQMNARAKRVARSVRSAKSGVSGVSVTSSASAVAQQG